MFDMCAECPGCGVQSSNSTVTCTQSCAFLASHGFPSSYSPNARYTWHITVHQGFYVEFTFHMFDVFESPMEECERDVVIITDFSLKSTASIIGR